MSLAPPPQTLEIEISSKLDLFIYCFRDVREVVFQILVQVLLNNKLINEFQFGEFLYLEGMIL